VPNVTPKDCVTELQWLSDCDILLTAAMYGNPPGGWSDPDRRQWFMDEVQEIEQRMREASARLKEGNNYVK
jgi:hypothetical protein